MAWGDGRRFDARRTAWHLMFATGDVEMIWAWDTEERDYVLQPVEMTSAWLERMKSNFDGQRAHMGRLGATPQPYPVSLQHAIEERIFYGWSPYAWEDADGLRWLGGIYALAYHPGGSVESGGVSIDLPAGLYSLIEWTPEAMKEIRDGKWSQISPTTVGDWRMTDGTVFEGDSLFAAALVDYGKLDSIGTLRDCLPYDTFELGDVEPHALAEDETAMVSFRSLRSAMRRKEEPSPEEGAWKAPQLRSAGAVILRRGSKRRAFARTDGSENGATNETPKPAVSPTSTSNERAMDNKQQTTPATEPETPQAATPRAADPAPTAQAEPAPEPSAPVSRSAEPAPQVPAAPSLVDEMRAIEEARFASACKALMEQRRLLVRDVPSVLERMRSGKPYDEFLGDYGVPTARAGHSTSDGDEERPAPPSGDGPVESRANNGRFTEVELVEWAQRSSESQGKHAIEIFTAREAEILAAGGTIERSDD